MTFVEHLRCLQERRNRQDPRLLEQAHEFANWYCYTCDLYTCDQLKLESVVWQRAPGDLRLFLRVLWLSHDYLLWSLLTDVLLANASLSARYCAELSKLVQLVNWWSNTAWRVLQEPDEWGVAYAICAYEIVLKCFASDEGVNLLRVALPPAANESRLLSAELVALLHKATPADVFASALEQLSREPKGNESEPLSREANIRRNPSGTGKNPEYEREIAESRLDLPEDAPSPLEVAPSSEPDPAEVVADRDAVERTLARFGKRTADLLRLMLDGRTAAEAARELGMSESTARVLLHKARKQFSRNP